MKIAQVLLASFALASFAAGCAVQDEGSDDDLDSRAQVLSEKAQSLAGEGSDGDLPYSDECEFYGDCAYCEDRAPAPWPYSNVCDSVCYAWYCGENDNGESCYRDCPTYAE